MKANLSHGLDAAMMLPAMPSFQSVSFAFFSAVLIQLIDIPPLQKKAMTAPLILRAGLRLNLAGSSVGIRFGYVMTILHSLPVETLRAQPGFEPPRRMPLVIIEHVPAASFSIFSTALIVQLQERPRAEHQLPEPQRMPDFHCSQHDIVSHRQSSRRACYIKSIKTSTTGNR